MAIRGEVMLPSMAAAPILCALSNASGRVIFISRAIKSKSYATSNTARAFAWPHRFTESYTKTQSAEKRLKNSFRGFCKWRVRSETCGHFIMPKSSPPVPARIISVSRRTDIPAYYADWFMRQVERGEVVYPNPISFKPVRLSLRPEHVLFLVFWTRNPHPLERHLNRLEELYARAFYFHFTINGQPQTLETNNPPLEFAVATFQRLASCYPRQVFWRYDPILLSDLTPPEYHLHKFEALAERLRGYTSRCYFSFVDWYQKVQRNLARVAGESGVRFREAELEERLGLVQQLNVIAKRHDMTLYSCCEDALCAVPQIAKARCVDIETIRALAPSRYRKLPASPTREDCGCYESRDIGYYDSCPHGCVYCYANRNRARAQQFHQAYLQTRRLPLDS